MPHALLDQWFRTQSKKFVFAWNGKQFVRIYLGILGVLVLNLIRASHSKSPSLTMCVCVPVHLYVSVCVCLCVCMCLCVRVSVYACVFLYLGHGRNTFLHYHLFCFFVSKKGPASQLGSRPRAWLIRPRLERKSTVFKFWCLKTNSLLICIQSYRPSAALWLNPFRKRS